MTTAPQEAMRLDYVAPSEATHFRVRKKLDEKNWQTQSAQIIAAADGGNSATLTMTTFEVALWPKTAAEIPSLLSSRWGSGFFRVQFYLLEDGKRPKPVGAPLEVAIEEHTEEQVASPPASATATAPANGVAGGALGLIGGLFGGQTGQKLNPNDPVQAAMLVVQQMMQWRSDEAAKLSRETEDRAKRERDERDRAFREELQRTRDFYKEMERIRTEADARRAREEDDRDDELEELRDELKELKSKQGSGALPKGMEWVGLVKEVAPHVMPTVGRVIGAAVEAAMKGVPAADAIAKAAQNVPPTGGAS